VHLGSPPKFHETWDILHADALLDSPGPVRVLGIDETRRGRPTWTQDPESGKWRLSERFETNFVDLAGTQGLLGQTAGRTTKTVTGWLDERGGGLEGGCGDRGDGPVRDLPAGRATGPATGGHRG